MDNKKVFSWIGIFLVGVIAGGLIIYLFCGNCSVICRESCKTEGKNNGGNVKDFVAKISVDTANAYFNCYMQHPRSISKLVAFSVSLEQLTAMQLLLANDSTARGFRIYMGMYGDPLPVNMVVATDEAGNDNAENIYKTSFSDPCPDLCDKESPIVAPPK